MPKATDTLGRNTKHFTEKDRSYRPREGNLGRFLMTKGIGWHGLANSEQLHELREAYGMGKDRFWTTKTLNKLYRGDLIAFDFQLEKFLEIKRSSYHIYRHCPHGERVLEEWDKLEAFIRPSGNDRRHQYGISSCTISVNVAAQRDGVTYSPGHVHLEEAETGLYCKEVGYTPDQLFSLSFDKLPEGKRPWYLYAVEFERVYLDDRTSDATPRVQTKSTEYYENKINKVIEYIGKLKYKDHLKTNTAMMVLFYFNHPDGEKKFHEVLASMQTRCKFIGTQVVEGLFAPDDKGGSEDLVPSGTMEHLYTGGYKRLGYDDYYINTP